ncbi:hypothetical protein [Streptomyces sp. NPDC093984]|uniref:hypothetical protein n=1 Tax=Streptomyces sp. NPDC093984 TaxID=3366052 RepID=UPI0037F587B2
MLGVAERDRVELAPRSLRVNAIAPGPEAPRSGPLPEASPPSSPQIPFRAYRADAGGADHVFRRVDVRDVVDLHLRAMLHPKAAGERFIAVGGPAISLFGMAQILREHFPAAADLLPSAELTIEQVREAAKTEPALRDAAALQGRIPLISNQKARSTLGWNPKRR